MHKIKQSMPSCSYYGEFPLARTHVFRQEHLVNVNVVLLLAQDGTLIQNGEAVISRIAALPQDYLAQRSHQILLAFRLQLLLPHQDLDDLVRGIAFSRPHSRIPEVVPRKASIARQMTVGVEMLGMVAVFGGRRCEVFLIVELVLGGADEVGLTGTHLPCILEDVSQSAPHLPRGAGGGPWQLSQAVPSLQPQVSRLFLSQSCTNLIKFSPAVFPSVARLIIVGFSCFHECLV